MVHNDASIPRSGGNPSRAPMGSNRQAEPQWSLRRNPIHFVRAEAMSSHTRLTGDGVDPEGPPIEMAMAYGDIGPGTMAAFGIE